MVGEATQLAHRPTVLIILDGWGVAEASRGNIIATAKTPVMDELTARYPAMVLEASGESVGLPWGEMGNSEVGHLSIGSGRIIYQDLPRITKAITDESYYTNAAFIAAAEHVKQHSGTLHIMGLMSSGGVHASNVHAYALLEFAKRQGLTDVRLHPILDGRDTAHNSGRGFIEQLIKKTQELGVGEIATLSGRFYAMDRDHRWDRIEKAYNAMTKGEGEKALDPLVAIDASYEKEVYDEAFHPTVITKEDGTPRGLIKEGDAVLFFNYRNDRARQLTQALVLPGFEKFPRAYLSDLFLVTMTEYEKNLPVTVAFPPQEVTMPLARVISDLGLTQLHIAETEKYAHVTFFFNGGKEDPFPGEERALVPSPQVATYDEKPEMSAKEVADKIIEAITKGTYDFIVVNFANADMVGHTGSIPAITKAVEILDEQVGRVVQAVLDTGGAVAITADHGNAEEKINVQTGFVNKEHTTNPVPLLLIASELLLHKGSTGVPPDLSTQSSIGLLADVAPTVLSLMGLSIPKEMEGRNLLESYAYSH
ncbi:MAG: 2,3-bisphosphoglycerate-independent phosphoglycerate mutase [Patescibacteria group bacterium]|jgi:2,3-bisphosphoglycerate-independent phosphoglycerate mutase